LQDLVNINHIPYTQYSYNGKDQNKKDEKIRYYGFDSHNNKVLRT